MPSLKSRLFRFILKHRHLLCFRLKRQTIDGLESIMALRRDVEKTSGRFGKMPAGLELESFSINGLAAEWIRPVEADRDRAILYFHGGAYVLGSCRAHRGIVAKFVQGSRIPALQFEYRLAPEHPFPAALDDALAAYRWLLANGVSPGRIVFMGDSAGGGLCLAVLLAIRDMNLPLPAAAAVLSPWTDLACAGESHQTKAKVDPAVWDGSISIIAQYYAGGNDLKLPWVSPLYGDLSGLPPLLVYVGEDEILLDDSTAFAAKAKNYGVEATLRVGEGLFHCYPILAPYFPEAVRAMEEICAFLKKHTG